MTSGRSIRRTVPAGSNESRPDDDDAVGVVAVAAGIVASGVAATDACAAVARCRTTATLPPIFGNAPRTFESGDGAAVDRSVVVMGAVDASRATGIDEAG